MSIKALYENIISSCIYRLVFENSVKALRVKLYDRETDDYKYYDFLLKFVQSAEIQKFLKEKNNTFEALQLVEQSRQDANDAEIAVSYATADEISGAITVTEFRDIEEVDEVLKKVIEIYKLKEEG